MKPMLASKWEDRNEDMFPFFAQPKLDGIRVLINDDGYAYTRSLKPVRNHVLQSMIRNTPGLIGLDGEIIVGDKTAEDAYRRTSSAVMSYVNDDIENAVLHIFDRWDMPFDDYETRCAQLMQEAVKWPQWIQPVETTYIMTMEELNVYEQGLLSLGNEGVILRKPDKFYKPGRGTPKQGELIKLKRFCDAEGRVVAVHELLHNANPATINELGYTEHSGHKENLVGMDTLGAIEVEVYSDDSPNLTIGTVRIGTGLTDSMRAEMWAQREELIGKIVKYKYFPVGIKDLPRFPVFLGIRDPDDMEPAQGDLFS